MPGTILVVDDHATFRDSVCALLDDAGWEVVGGVSDGASALVATAELRPDVVLLDIGLPDVDGLDLAVLLAGSGHPPRVVLVSARLGATYGARLAAAPVIGFLTKSEFSVAALQGLLRP